MDPGNKCLSGFFLACQNCSGRFDESFPTCDFFFTGDQLVHINFNLFMPRISQKWLSKLIQLWTSSPWWVVSLVPWWRPTPWLDNIVSHSNFIGSRVYVCLAVTCHLHFWQNDRGLLRARAIARQCLKSWRLKPNQPQKDYIRAEGDFHKEKYSWKDQ